MYTATSLREQTVKDLGKLATKFGLKGWRSMRKDELVQALVRAARAKARASAKRSSRGKSESRTTAKPAARSRSTPAARVRKTNASKAKPSASQPVRKKSTRVVKRIQKANAERERQKNLSTPPAASRSRNNGSNGRTKPLKPKPKPRPAPPKRTAGGIGAQRDRVVLLVRDAYWLQAVWELTRQSVERAQAAMAEHWHTARPVLRLIEVEGGATTSTAERVMREIEIHGGVNTWYIDVPGVAKCYRVDIGYLSSNGKFFSLSRSNTVTPPRPGNGNMAEEDWSDIAEDCEKIYALSGGYSDEAGSAEVQELFEERLGRPMGGRSGARFGVGADKMLNRQRDFLFEVDAEMIVFGSTKPNAHVTLAGTPVKLRPDGTFTARLSMPDRRQVLPVVASSADGVEQRTVVLAVERNTKVMEPRIRESHE